MGTDFKKHIPLIDFMECGTKINAVKYCESPTEIQMGQHKTWLVIQQDRIA